MRFITPAQTFAEHKHREMPMFETLGLSAGSAALLGGALAGAGSIGAGLLSRANNPKAPSYKYNPQSGIDLGAQMFSKAAGQAMDYAPQFTQSNIDLQNKVTPGSSAQRELALKQLNSYIQGSVPTDVQQNIQRQVAQNLGGGFSNFTGGGQAQNNFARNIGQTSLGLSQYGLSAAPTWQQLANQMVASPTQILGSALSAQSLGAQVGMGVAENQYQSAFNQYGSQMAQNQQLGQILNTGLSTGLNAFGAINKANYLNSLGQGAQATLGQFASTLPSYNNATSYMKDLGYSNAGSGFTALGNTGAGTAYPFGY